MLFLTSALTGWLLIFLVGLAADRIEPHSRHTNQPAGTNGLATRDTSEDTSHTEGWCLTKLEPVKHSLTWTISNYSLLTQEVGHSTTSSTISSDNKSKWQLRLYPAGVKEGYLSVYLVLSETQTESQPIKTKYRMSIMDVTDLEAHTKVYDKAGSFKLNSPRGFDDFISLQDLQLLKPRVLPDDKLTIRCQVYAQAETKHQSGQVIQSPVHKSGLQEDLAHLLDSEELSDLTIVVAGKEFKVHKAILMARSPVFWRMFSSDMQKSGEPSRVQLDDIEPDLFRELIRYIYTGNSQLSELESHQSNQDDLALRLLAAAAKYQLAGLKSICEQTVHRNLSIESLIEVLSLADQNKCDWLLDRSIEYLMRHANEFTQIGGWQVLAKQRPELLGQILARHWMPDNRKN